MARVARKTGWALGAQIAGLAWRHPRTARLRGGVVATLGAALAVSLATYNSADPSLNAASAFRPTNALGSLGATLADVSVQSLGVSASLVALLMVMFGLYRAATPHPDQTRRTVRLRALVGTLGLLALAGFLAAPPAPSVWPLARGLGGFWGDGLLHGLAHVLAFARLPLSRSLAAILLAGVAIWALGYGLGIRRVNLSRLFEGLSHALASALTPTPATAVPAPVRASVARRARAVAEAPIGEVNVPAFSPPESMTVADTPSGEPVSVAIKTPKAAPKDSGRELREAQGAFDFVKPAGFLLPELAMLAKPKPRASQFDEGALRQNAQLLESVLAEFGVRGQIDQIRPGPVVTLYELVPAAGVKSARVVALSDDIARSMSVAACRVSVVSGRNAIGIELPNARRETVYLRDLLASSEYEKSSPALPMALGETIGGEPYIADLSKMPHLLIAGTTGSGK